MMAAAEMPVNSKQWAVGICNGDGIDGKHEIYGAGSEQGDGGQSDESAGADESEVGGRVGRRSGVTEIGSRKKKQKAESRKQRAVRQ